MENSEIFPQLSWERMEMRSIAVGLLEAMCIRWLSIEPLYDADPKQMLGVLSVIVELRDIVGMRLRFELQLMQRSMVKRRFLFGGKAQHENLKPNNSRFPNSPRKVIQFIT